MADAEVRTNNNGTYKYSITHKFRMFTQQEYDV